MKKLLLGLGSIMTVVAPVAAVISCGDDKEKNNTNTQTTTKGGETAISATLKDVITRAYPSIHTEDIKEAKILNGGYDIKMGTLVTKMDYAVQYTFNKEAAIEITPFNENVKDGTKVIFAVKKSSGLTKVILQETGSVTQKTHTITGSQKNLIIDMLKNQGMTINFTPATEQTQPVAEHHETQTPEVQTPTPEVQAPAATGVQPPARVAYDFTSDIAKFNGLTFISTKTLEQIDALPQMADDADEVVMSGADLGITIPSVSEGTTFELLFNGSVTVNNENQYEIMVNFTHGEDQAHAIFKLRFARESAPQGQVNTHAATVDYDFSADMAKFEDLTFVSTKTHDEINALPQMGDNPIDENMNAEDLGITMPELSEGTTAAFTFDSAFDDDGVDTCLFIVTFTHGTFVNDTVFYLTFPTEGAQTEQVQEISLDTIAGNLQGTTIASTKAFEELDRILHDSSFEVDGYATFHANDLGINIDVPANVSVDMELIGQVDGTNNFEMDLYLEKDGDYFEGETRITITPAPSVHHELPGTNPQPAAEVPEPEMVIAPPVLG